MARDSLKFSLIVSLAFAILLVPLTTVQAEQDEIIERLRLDLEEAEQRNRRLEQELEEQEEEKERLRQKIDELEAELEVSTPAVAPETVEIEEADTEEVDEPLPETVEEVSEPESEHIVERADTLPEPVESVERTLKNVHGERPELYWEYGPHRAYPILARPLQRHLVKTITADDSLTKLAHQFYHDSDYWELIHQYNSEIIADPNALPGGREIDLPPIYDLEYLRD